MTHLKLLLLLIFTVQATYGQDKSAVEDRREETARNPITVADDELKLDWEQVVCGKLSCIVCAFETKRCITFSNSAIRRDRVKRGFWKKTWNKIKDALKKLPPIGVGVSVPIK